MSLKIKKAAVLGAGVMGATIAAHLTNAGIECYLLDIIPFELTDADKKKGLTEKARHGAIVSRQTVWPVLQNQNPPVSLPRKMRP